MSKNSLKIFLSFALLPGILVGCVNAQTVGEAEWTGEIKTTGIYKIKVYMSCLEGFVEGEFEKLKPKFRYTLKVQTK